jgi:hypothetical protein
VGDGGFIPVYLHSLTVIIAKLKLSGRIGFSDRLGIGINILGWESMFDNHLVCFDGKKRVVQTACFNRQRLKSKVIHPASRYYGEELPVLGILREEGAQTIVLRSKNDMEIRLPLDWTDLGV